MNYETEIINGHTAVVRHFFKPHEIKVGSRWISSCGYIVTVEEIKKYRVGYHGNPSKEYDWYEIYYSWEENGVKKTHDKDQFAFQCRYFLIVE